MEEPDVNLKDPWLAAFLAFLVPGLGHLYQRRLFKAAVYFFCIVGLYAWGMSLSYGKIVQAPTDGQPRRKTISFAAQAGVGLPALYAMYQAKRYNNGAAEEVTSLPPGEEFASEFTGQLNLQQGNDEIQDEVTGLLRVAGDSKRFGERTLVGRFEGQTATGKPVEIRLGEGTVLGPVLGPDPERFVEAPVVDGSGEDVREVGRLVGTVPRSLWNWFEAPMNNEQEQQLHRELGKVHELALVFTWIAGLLNLLAIWDALEGPAYGFGLAGQERAPDNPDQTAEQTTTAESPQQAEVASPAQ